MPGATELRPLSLGELLDRTFTLYRNHFWLFVGIMALPQFVIVILSLLLQRFMSPFLAVPASSGSPPAPAEMARILGGFFFGALVGGVVYYIVYAMALGATTFAVSDVYLGRPATVQSAYRNVRGRFWSLLGLIFLILLVLFFAYLVFVAGGMIVGILLGIVLGPLAVVGVFLGFLAGMVCAVMLGMSFGVAIPALLLEKLTIFQALTRSMKLTKGNLGRIFLTFLLMGVITYAIIAVFQGPFLAAMFMTKGGQISLWLQSLSVISGGAGGVLSGPLLMIGLSLLYYDARVRKEAFDLQVMMAALGPAAPPAGATPPPEAGTSGPSPSTKA